MSTWTKTSKSSTPTWTKTSQSTTGSVTISSGSTLGFPYAMTYEADITVGGGTPVSWTHISHSSAPTWSKTTKS